MARAHHEDHLLSHEGREGGAAREVDREVGGVRGERYRLVGEQARRRVRRRRRETNLQAAACGERWSWVSGRWEGDRLREQGGLGGRGSRLRATVEVGGDGEARRGDFELGSDEGA